MTIIVPSNQDGFQVQEKVAVAVTLERLPKYAEKNIKVSSMYSKISLENSNYNVVPSVESAA